MELKDVTCTWQEWGGGGSTILTRGTKATPTQNKQQQKLGQYVFKEL
jgi:hypothetical protein